jgi:acyl-CoA thioesterase-1
MTNTLIKYFNLLIITSIIALVSCKEEKKTVNSENVSNKTDSTNTMDISKNVKKILFFGNSITAGYGLEPHQAFTYLVQQKIDSLGLKYQVVNAGLSGETTASGKNRVNWVLKQPVDIFVLELGANDGLRGIPLEETQKNLIEIIQKVKEQKPNAQIVLACMQIPPSMGPEYTKRFKDLFPEVAKQTNAHLIPFLLEGVAGEPDLNLKDGIHPNEKGERIVAENVWKMLKGIL